MSTKKQKRVVARKVEQLPDGMGVPHHFYYVLPADAASYAAMVEQMAKATQRADHQRGFAMSPVPNLAYHRTLARAALGAIGIKEGRK